MRRKWLGLKKSGGEGGIRTLGTGVSPYNGLANRRIRPLCHLSGPWDHNFAGTLPSLSCMAARSHGRVLMRAVPMQKHKAFHVRYYTTQWVYSQPDDLM